MMRPFTKSVPVRLCACGFACVCAGLPVFLSGCTTPEQRAAQAQADVAQMMAIYGPACSRLGYAVQSDPWRNCVVNLSTKYDLQRYGPGYYGWGPGYWRGGWRDPYS